MNRTKKQNFVTIPYELFITMLNYKARAAGIRFVVTEENYTSKASFLDRDEMPVYDITYEEIAVQIDELQIKIYHIFMVFACEMQD